MIRLLSSLALAAGCCLLLPACSSTTYLALRPAQGSGEWRDGYELATTAQDSIRLNVKFVRYEGTQVVFWFGIDNQSSRPVLVAPESFAYLPVAMYLPRGETYLPYFKNAVAAVNPEGKLNAITQDLSQNLQASRGSDLLLTPNYAVQTRIAGATGAVENRLERTEAEAQLLRKNTLPAGKTLTGLVYFPRTDNADALRFTVPMRTQPMEVEYRQLHASKPFN